MNDGLSQQERYLSIRNVTLVGVVVNIGLTIAQILFGIIDQSQALLADGLHTLSDLVSDVVVLIAAKYSAEEADTTHPYGHARFETLATVIVGAILLFVAMEILLNAVQKLLSPESLPQPGFLSLTIVIIAILSKEALYQYTIYVSKRTQSLMLKANAWHHRSDAISSVIVLIGIGGTLWGFYWLDAVAAIGVSFMIAHIGWSLGRSGLQQLVDTGLADEQLQHIKGIISSVDGVHTLHDLRTRSMGSTVLVDVHILVDPRISVSEGHQIGEVVRQTLIKEVAEIGDVLVHIDPENDEQHLANLTLPLRKEITGRLQTKWQMWGIKASIQQMTLHYLGGRLTIDIYLSLRTCENLEETAQLSQRLTNMIQEEELNIHTVRVYFSQN